MDAADIGILAIVRNHHKGLSTGQQGLHQPQVFFLSILGCNTMEGGRGAEENQSSHQNGNDNL
ncbi:MAG: hypothetical protein II209_02195, partial [Alistipes sp.]|nr:hypothetical protein [Alistipes sp.]